MRLILMILTVIAAGTGCAVIGAGISLFVQTTRSPVAAFIWRMAGGGGGSLGGGAEVRSIDSAGFHDRITDLFARHAEMHPDDAGPTMESYRTSLKKAGGAVMLLGLALLAAVTYVFMLASPYMG